MADSRLLTTRRVRELVELLSFNQLVSMEVVEEDEKRHSYREQGDEQTQGELDVQPRDPTKRWRPHPCSPRRGISYNK
jgi:hypothetical protein